MATETLEANATYQQLRDRMAVRAVAPEALGIELDESTALNATFSDTEVEGVLDDHAEAINAIGAAFDALVADLVASGVLSAAPEA
jgi:hypothetical protein